MTRATARAELLAHLDALTAAGHPPVCWGVPLPERAYWTADDLAEQAVAARLCTRCPAMTVCRQYGATFPKESGVYGGLTEHDRRHPRRPKTKEVTG